MQPTRRKLRTATVCVVHSSVEEGRSTEEFAGSKAVVHVLDWTCKSQRHVTRSIFSAELLSAGDAADQGILISQMIHELEHGPMTALEARNRRMEGGYVPTAIYLDAKSVYAAVSATFNKQPAKKSSLCHVQHLRERVDKRVLAFLFWIDTWDMGADGLSKGVVARSLLHTYMDGFMPLQHEHDQWTSKVAHMHAARAGSGSPLTEASFAPRLFRFDAKCEVQSPIFLVTPPSHSLPEHTLTLQPFSAQAAAQQPKASLDESSIEQFCAEMADLEVGATVSVQWAEKLGGLPEDFYWFNGHL